MLNACVGHYFGSFPASVGADTVVCILTVPRFLLKSYGDDEEARHGKEKGLTV